MAKTRRPTSHDVARLAGVSRATVSAVLSGTNGTIRVSEATRQRVLEAAARLTYSPDPFARALRRQSSHVLGFVARSLKGQPYEEALPYQMSVKITEAARAFHYHVVQVDGAEFGEDDGGEGLALFLLSQRVEGVVFDAPPTAGGVSAALARGLAVVQLMRPQFDVPTPLVTVDARPGIEAAVDHLVELGHARVAFVGRGGDHPVDRARCEAFLAALAQRDVAIQDRYLRLESDYGLEQGHRAALALLDLPHPPTAVLAASDGLALGVLRALYDAGVRVPEGMSLVSYDDTFAAELYPPLTSISQPLGEVARGAVGLLLETVGNQADGSASRHLELPTYLTLRRSTGPPPAS